MLSSLHRDHDHLTFNRHALGQSVAKHSDTVVYQILVRLHFGRFLISIVSLERNAVLAILIFHRVRHPAPAPRRDCLQRQILQASKQSAGEDRYTPLPRQPSLTQHINTVLEQHENIFNPAVLQTTSSTQQVQRIITDLGRRHSARAAHVAFDWFRRRAGGVAPVRWQGCCIAACIHNGDLKTAEAMYTSMVHSGGTPDSSLLTILIVGCCHQGKVETALQVDHCLIRWFGK